MDANKARRIGEHLRSARRRRGLSLRNLADLAGVSVGYLSMVENGRRLLDRSSHIAALAEALQIAPAELVGQPFVLADPRIGTAHDMIPTLRLTLMGLPPDQHLPELPVDVLNERVARTTRLYHAAEYGHLASELPDLLGDLHAAVEAAEGTVRHRLLELLAGVYHPACALLLKNLGYPDLAFIAVTRAAEAIAELDDPAHEALSGFFHTHVVLAAGSPAQALEHATAAINVLERHLTRPDAYALLGELHLLSATCVAGDVRRPGSSRIAEVHEHLDEAEALAHRTNETGAWRLNFGPTNVGIHRVSLSTDLGLHGQAVAASGRVHPEALPGAPGRQAAFHTDLARSLAHARGREADAVAALLTAEKIARQRVHTNPAVRTTVDFLTTRPLPANAARDLRGMAHRIGLAH